MSPTWTERTANDPGWTDSGLASTVTGYALLDLPLLVFNGRVFIGAEASFTERSAAVTAHTERSAVSTAWTERGT